MLKFLKIEDNAIKIYTDIISKLPDNYTVGKQILELIDNRKTKIKFDRDIKHNYYVFLNDTIYLSDCEKSQTCFQRIAVIAHECAHSKQNKVVQSFNFIFANIELVAFVMTMVLIINRYNPFFYLIIYLMINLASIIPRLVLEIDATLKTGNICKSYLKDKVTPEELNILHAGYNTNKSKYYAVFLALLLSGKVVRMFIVLLLYLILNL